MNQPLEVTTDVACRVVGINPFRLNEHVAAGRFPCMPSTNRGRYRVFNIDDLLALWLFRSYLDRGLKVKDAGDFACKIAAIARNNPDADAISVVQLVNGSRSVHLADAVPDRMEWGKEYFSGSIIHDVDTFNIKQIREIIAERVEADEGSEK